MSKSRLCRRAAWVVLGVVLMLTSTVLAVNAYAHSYDYDFLAHFGANERDPHAGCGPGLTRIYQFWGPWEAFTQVGRKELEAKGWKFYDQDKDGIRFRRVNDYLQFIPASPGYPIEVVVAQDQPPIRKFWFGFNGHGWECSDP